MAVIVNVTALATMNKDVLIAMRLTCVAKNVVVALVMDTHVPVLPLKMTSYERTV